MSKTVSPLAMASEIKTIKEGFGKNAIIIKDNLVFRCSTEVLEKGPKCLTDLLLPNYGKMRKFIVKDDGVHELIMNEGESYDNSHFAQYTMKEEVDADGHLVKTFHKLNTVIEASLPEEIGVEFMLKDINDSSRIGSMSKVANDKVMSFKALLERLTQIREYLNKVVHNKIPLNPQIIYNIQEIFNYLPNFENENVIKAYSVQTNNNYLVLYLTWVIKSIIALHKLINNKIELKEREQNPEVKEEKKEEKKEEEAKKVDDKKAKQETKK